MAVRPIDSLTMVPRLNEAGRAVQQQEQYPNAFQQVLGAQVQQRAERERTQVLRKEQAEQAAIRKEEQGQGRGGEGRPERDRRQVATESPTASDTGTGGRLDVKV